MKIKSLLIVVTLIVLLFNAACQTLNPEVTETPTRVPTATRKSDRNPLETPTPTEFLAQATVTIWHSWDESQIPVLVQIQRGFRELYPDVHFDVLYVPINDLLARFEAEARRGAGPTIVLGPAAWGPLMYQSAIIADLSDMADSEWIENINPPALKATSYQGALIGLPYAIEGVVLYRNKRIIPTKAEDLDELIADAQFATGGDQIGAILERSFFYAGGHLEGIGGKLMDEDRLPAFNDDKGLEWLELLDSFDLAGPTSYLDNQGSEAFMEGRVGWIIDGTWNMVELAEMIGPENLAIDSWPAYGDGNLAGYVQSENIYLSAQAEGVHLKASQDFIAYFLSSEAQIQLTAIGLIPSSMDVQVVDVTSGHLINQAITALASGQPYPPIPEIEIYNIQMDIALKTFYDGAEASSVLASAERAILEQLNQSEAAPSPTETLSP